MRRDVPPWQAWQPVRDRRMAMNRQRSLLPFAAVLAWLAVLGGPAAAGDDKEPPDKAKDGAMIRGFINSNYPGLGRMTPYDFQFEYKDVELVSDDPKTNTKTYVRKGRTFVNHALFIDGQLASIRKLTLSTNVTGRGEEKEAYYEVNATATQLPKPTVEGTEGLPEDERKVTALYRAWVAEEEGLKFESAV